MLALIWVVFGILGLVGVITQYHVFKIGYKNRFQKSELTEKDRVKLQNITIIRLVTFALTAIAFILIFIFNRK